MNRFQRTISVVSNPWAALDHKGRPCGIVLVEPTSGSGSLGFIGARIDSEKTKISPAGKGDIRGNRQDTVFRFDASPVEVKATSYYKGALVSGALLPADKETAEFAGLKFGPVDTALAKAKADAIKGFDSLYGAGSHEKLTGPKPVAAPATASAPTPAPATESPALETTSDATHKRKADK